MNAPLWTGFSGRVFDVRNLELDIPWMRCSGTFAESTQEMQRSYLMSYGASLPESFAAENLEGWISVCFFNLEYLVE